MSREYPVRPIVGVGVVVWHGERVLLVQRGKPPRMGHWSLPGGVDPDLYSARSSATKSEHGGISRVRRGGCWADEGWPCRSASRPVAAYTRPRLAW